jgi:hypothetical protein
MESKREPAALSGPLGAALRALAAAFSGVSVPAMLIGGMAVIARGVPRLTRDVDGTVAGGDLEVGELVEKLGAHQLVPRIEDAISFATEHQVLLLRHEASGIDVDLSLAWLPFELEALAASERLDLGGVSIQVARAEDLIIYKAVAFRPQDQQDIERLLTLHAEQIDLDRVRKILAEFAQAIEAPERPEDLERIIRRVLG